MAGTIFVFIEEHEGEVRKASLQALGAGLDLAAKLGARTVPLVVGSHAHDIPALLGKYGVAEAAVSRNGHFYSYLPEAWSRALAPALEKEKPFLFLAGCSAESRDLLPRLAQRLGGGYLGDVTACRVEAGKTIWTRPIYAGKAAEEVEMLTATSFITLRPNSFPVPAVSASPASVAVRELEVGEVSGLRSHLARTVQSQGLDKVELTEADIVVSGGIGVGGPEGYEPLKELCQAMGAALGASRAAVHAGWIDPDHQVGQTGKTVSPSLYVACGISGMIQHQAGMRTSKCIVAINTDREAPMFGIADYGIVGDLHKIVPALTEEMRKAR